MKMPRSEFESRLHSQIFDRLPCAVAVIDRSYRVTDTNATFNELFGEGRDRPCHEVYKNRPDPCPDCVAARTFADGQPHVNEETGVDRNGHITHYIVHTAPVTDAQGLITHVAEMSVDVTDIKRLQREYNVLFELVPCYVAILNRDLRIVRGNELLRSTFGEPAGKCCYEVLKHRSARCPECPAEKTFRDGKSHISAHTGLSQDGRETQYIVTTSALPPGEEKAAYVIEMALDVTAMRRLEREKIEAERLAAMGQTVAGLAHGIKNILTGLEGGMYVVNSGIRKSDSDKINQGWEMLERNIGRITELTKNLLAFSKGRRPNVRLVDPGQLVGDVCALYRDAAAQDGIRLTAEVEPSLAPAPMDPEAIHTCLANLVSNALDACLMSEKPDCGIVVRCLEKDGAVCFEVADAGCGMDYDVKQKAFTSFFTTKGAGGTGLGLLLTRKIAQEHGGRVTLESTPGAGSCFRLVFPRDRLPPLEPAAEESAP
jgi:PAS domain S-box-containing protein